MNESTDYVNIRAKVGDLSYNPDDIIARGSYAIVFKGIHYKDRKQVAIKRTELIRVRDDFVQMIRDHPIFKVSDHPNVLRCHCTEKNGDFL